MLKVCSFIAPASFYLLGTLGLRFSVHSCRPLLYPDSDRVWALGIVITIPCSISCGSGTTSWGCKVELVVGRTLSPLSMGFSTELQEHAHPQQGTVVQEVEPRFILGLGSVKASFLHPQWPKSCRACQIHRGALRVSQRPLSPLPYQL